MYAHYKLDCSSNPCSGHGICNNTPTSFTCACKTGYTGSRCQIDCKSNPCSGRGICHNSLTGFTCTCNAGYKGSRCQAVKTTTTAATPSQTPLSSCMDDPRVMCSSSICSVGALKTYCPLTCKMCTPCSDSNLVNCKHTAVCNDTTLKNYCKATCGLCSKKTIVSQCSIRCFITAILKKNFCVTGQNSSPKTTSWIHIRPTPTPTRWIHVGGK
ncbi:NOTCH1 [Mytilus coruscus]|uniref:NOTCH1 n=1 Tax=Mytilus coruscus TaxID=42192 RepID=A0A6J8D6C7_MYTCO|nr:NOTCH1 [Mytilus coruscus]